MTHLKEGDKAPVFEFINVQGEKKSLADYKGQKVIVYFYPKDNTPGCNAEACNLRDNYEDLSSLGYEVIGISPDSEQSHQKFRGKFNLPFHLVADTEKKILEDYGVLGEKKMFGKILKGVNRTTFIVAEDGSIEKIFKKVKTKEHTEQILDAMNKK